MSLTQIKVLVFDFDGVIVSHSEFFKESAWEEIFAPYDGRHKKFLDEARSMFGFGKKGDRFDILRYVYKKLDEEEEAIPTLVSKNVWVFNKIVQEKIAKAGVVNGGMRALEGLASRFSLYVNSSTTVEALNESVQALELNNFFSGIFGGPASKVENFKKIAELEGVTPFNILMIGDSDGDFKAADDFGCHFVGVSNEWNMWKKKPFPLITNLEEIKLFVKF